MRKIILFLIAFSPVVLFSQVVENPGNTGKLELGLFLGVSTYEGDVHCFDDDELNYFSELGFAFGVQVKKYFSDAVGVRLAYHYFKLQGIDNNFSVESQHPDRGFSFENNLNELSAIVDFEPFAKRIYDDNGIFKGGISPYLFAGLGMGFGSITTDYNKANQGIELLEDIGVDERDGSSSSIAIPLGIGVKLYLAEAFSLGLEFGVRLAVTDYLDGVKVSGNPDANDYYGAAGLTLHYILK